MHMNPVSTANKLKTLRELKGVSQERIAEKAELNLEDYQSMELGEQPVSPQRLNKVCHALGVDFTEWFGKGKASSVFVNNGSIHVSDQGVVVNNCENCFFISRSEEESELLKSLVNLVGVLVEKLNADEER